jgi:hypothetical protein
MRSGATRFIAIITEPPTSNRAQATIPPPLSDR